MAERSAASDEESPHVKRRKLASVAISAQENIGIHSSKNLHELLTFEQDTGSNVKHSQFGNIVITSVQTKCAQRSEVLGPSLT